jgi:hypothetical protein
MFVVVTFKRNVFLTLEYFGDVAVGSPLCVAVVPHLVLVSHLV